jgi:hypothetical protein
MTEVVVLRDGRGSGSFEPDFEELFGAFKTREGELFGGRGGGVDVVVDGVRGGWRCCVLQWDHF